MKRIILLIPLLSFTLLSFAQQRIRVTDFGAKPNSGEDTRLAFQRAVASCGGKNAIIEFPKGRYDFYQQESEESTTAMHLRDAENITIEGNGSEFFFHGKMRVVLVEQSQGITLRNFSTDWERTYISQGEFVNIQPDYVDLRIDPKEYPFEVADNRIRFLGEGWTAGVHDSYLNIHTPSGEIAYRTRDDHTGNIFKGRAEQIAPDVVRFFGKVREREVPVEVGQKITLYHGTYIMTGIEIGYSKDVVLEDITLYHALSTGVYGFRTENITLRRVSAKPRTSRGRVFSTVADASHFTCCRGEILIDGCAHTGQGDDFINVRGTYSRISEVVGDNAVRVGEDGFLSQAIRSGRWTTLQ